MDELLALYIYSSCGRYLCISTVCSKFEVAKFRFTQLIVNDFCVFTETVAENLNVPPQSKIVEWPELSREPIAKSFKSCSLHLALDGSEDDKIVSVKDSHANIGDGDA